MRGILVGFVFLLFFIPTVSAADWYVRPAGGNYGNENGADYDNAWDGLGNVVWGAGGVDAGDTLYICGTHVMSWNGGGGGINIVNAGDVDVISGSAGNPTIVRGDYPGDPGIVWGAYYPNDEPWSYEENNTYSTTIDGGMYRLGMYFEDISGSSATLLAKTDTIEDCKNNPGTYYSTDYQGGSKLYVHCSDNGNPTNRVALNRWGYDFKIQGDSYITFKNLTMMSIYQWFGLKNQEHHMTWDGCTMIYSEGAPIVNRANNNVHDITVTGCTIHNTREGFEAAGGPGGTGLYNFTISNNTIYDCGSPAAWFPSGDRHGISIQDSHDGVISGNDISNCNFGIVLYANNADQEIKNITVKNNYVHDMWPGTICISFSMDNHNVGVKSGNKIHHNIVSNCTYGIRNKHQDYSYDVYNNVLYNCGTGLIHANSNQQSINFVDKNNIFLNCNTNINIQPDNEGGTKISDHNCFYPAIGNSFHDDNNGGVMTYATWQSNGYDTNSVASDPQFENANGDYSADTDFKITSGSPCKDVGDDVGLTLDYEGNPIPYGSAPDIGVYEYQAVYYIDKDSIGGTCSDSNPGTVTEPWCTIGKANAELHAGDTVYIKAGTYDLAGFSTNIDYPLTLIGEDKDSTILTNGGTLTFSNSLTVKNLKFTNYPGTVLKPMTGSGEVIDGFVVENCIFDNVINGISTGKDNQGTITNVRISNNEFSNIDNGGVVIIFGLLSDIKVNNNIFNDLISYTHGVSAITIGSNADRPTTRDILISGNHMDTIVGSTEVVNGSGHEVHGILAYGTNVSILGNTVKNLNAAQDHEAIYMKAKDSIIANNLVENCGSGSGGADIAVKGGEESTNNVVSGNKIISDQPGRGMLLSGDLIISNNYVKKTNGTWAGIDCYVYERAVIVADNSVEVNGVAVYLHDSVNSVISDNLLISLERTIKIRGNSSGTQTSGNVECVGDNCTGLMPPNPKCQNMGYLCCNSCQSGPHPEYNGDCTNQVCCDMCGEVVPGDLNWDRVVDILDLGIVASDFGKTSGFDPRADVIPNSEIDIYDVVFVASRFT